MEIFSIRIIFNVVLAKNELWYIIESYDVKRGRGCGKRKTVFKSLRV